MGSFLLVSPPKPYTPPAYPVHLLFYEYQFPHLIIQCLSFTNNTLWTNHIILYGSCRKSYLITFMNLVRHKTDMLSIKWQSWLRLPSNILRISSQISTRIQLKTENSFIEFYVLLTVHLGMILVNNQPDAQFFMYVYFYSLHVSGSHVRMIRRIILLTMGTWLRETCR